MHKVHRKALVAHDSKKMFQLINDVAEYPKFLKWCIGSHILESDEKQMTAGLTVKLAGIKQKFTTKNTFETTEKGYKVHLDLIDGPFDYLQGTWFITTLADDFCKVELILEFNFKTGLLNRAFKTGFSKIAQQLIADFIERANHV